MSDSPIKFASSPSSSEDKLPSHQSFEENVSSDDGRSNYSPPWSSKEDLEEEDEDNADVENDDDDSDSNSDGFNSDSDFDSPPPK